MWIKGFKGERYLCNVMVNLNPPIAVYSTITLFLVTKNGFMSLDSCLGQRLLLLLTKDSFVIATSVPYRNDVSMNR